MIYSGTTGTMAQRNTIGKKARKPRTLTTRAGTSDTTQAQSNTNDQNPQVSSAVGNTISTATRVRNRNWCFTLHDYTADDIILLQQSSYQYVFQEEKAPTTGALHLQGLLIFKNAVSFSTVKAICARCHWEPCKNLIASKQYCSKEESRIGNIYTNIKEIKNEKADTVGTQELQTILNNPDEKKKMIDEGIQWMLEQKTDIDFRTLEERYPMTIDGLQRHENPEAFREYDERIMKIITDEIKRNEDFEKKRKQI